MKNAMEIRGLVKAYGARRALNGLDLDVPAGSLFGLIGSNGAGKTTMMTLAMGLIRPDEGQVNLLGEGAFHPARHAGRVALLPQDARLPLHARVFDLLFFYARLQGMPASLAREQIHQLLAWVNLADRAGAAVRTLSHGMMRRLTIAQAFLGAPELVFLDEPMSGLDPREVARIRDLLISRRGHQAIVISSHVLSELELVCDHVAFVEKGRLVRQGSLVAMLRQHHRVTYHLHPGVVPLDKLRQELPEVDWTVDAIDNTLVALLPPEELDVSRLNGIALRILLAAGVGIVEVRRGSDLESEFLAATGGR